ncbi:protein NBR1 homolog isoform X2 [Neltuma alba]|uniref:protein NBR1 homolog isoform X2 n=1 Tax=Neltuma alba TaxID=207710 RepID=UPI0010A330C7|nr:protein NBR1 homolog isoform X2 [Prosopis alba]XP_028798107.1 protein NBR1 homolog isoform X2 [Prosopis alba]
MESTLVIKVKFGDTLRRFNARVDENNQLDLDMARLRFKICSLFNIPLETNLVLRYVDEDGDLVTLVDDDDLLDVMRQNLKFLKIDLHMMNDNASKANSMASGSSTPLRSPRILNPFMGNGNTTLSDDLKSVPEPVLEFLSNLSLNLASKAASSSPVVGSLMDSIAKLGQSMGNSNSRPVTASVIESKSDACKESVPHVPSCPQPPSADSPSEANQQLNENVTGGVAAPVAPVDLNVAPSDSNPPKFSYVDAVRVSSTAPEGDSEKGKKAANDNMKCKGGSPRASTSQAAPGNFSTQSPPIGFSPFVECPFSGLSVVDSAARSFENHRGHPFKRSYSHTEAMGGMFHKGVRCDGCGVYPITGPRYKSKVKGNYDLCSICFAEIGNGTDYVKIDRPLPCRRPGPFKILNDYRHVTSKTKIDSKFILDVTVIDGTLMAPSTTFTKIWRMRNSGTVPWPKGCQLVWIGGDKFSDSHSVNLEIPMEGLPVDKELDIAVEFRAPESPGQYISYWRMAFPTGQKFGQRVWVLIQVDPSLKESFYDNFQGLNLNMPLEESGSRGPNNIDINVHPEVDEAFLHSCNSSAPEEFGKQQVDEQPRQEPGENIFKDGAKTVGLGGLPPTTSGQHTAISYPVVDFSDAAPVVVSNPQAPCVGALTSSSRIDGDNSIEETLLKELEEMGFKQVDLNKEILRMNEYDLEQSVDDLCGVSEWDPLLDELREMGFRDNEVNRRLLKKNNGSIKRVVLDLVNGEDH